MNTIEKLEFVKHIYSRIGVNEIEKAFKDSPVKNHLINKFRDARQEHGQWAGIEFLLSLDIDNATIMFRYLGL